MSDVSVPGDLTLDTGNSRISGITSAETEELKERKISSQNRPGNVAKVHKLWTRSTSGQIT